MEIKGNAINMSPMFKGQIYDYWKQRVITLFDAIPLIFICDVVENGDHIPLHDDGTHFLRSLWNEEQKLRTFKDLKKLTIKDLIGTLKVYEIELREYERQRKRKSITLKAQKASKKTLSKAFNMRNHLMELLKKMTLTKMNCHSSREKYTLRGGRKANQDG
ncbi:hypothetical protein CR513_08409, partial [Mucuna pruriens]